MRFYNKKKKDAIANELLDYFQNLENAKKFAEVFCLPHHHHHEKKFKKTPSGSNLHKMTSSGNFVELNKKGLIPSNNKFL